MRKIVFTLLLFGYIVYYYVLQKICLYLEITSITFILLLLTLYLLYIYFLYIKDKGLQFIIYLISLIIILFRKSNSGENFDFYLWKWLKYIFTNPIILINVIGNLIIFIPLGIYMKILFPKYVYLGLVMIILIEAIQGITKRGVFDIVDIFLNYIGFLTGIVGEKIWQKSKKIKKIIRIN